MLFAKYKGALDQSQSDKRTWQQVGVLASLTSCVLAATLMVIGKGTEKTIIAPPVVSKTFWVDGDQISPEYVEQMADYFAGLALSANPNNVKYRQQLLLQYVAPGAYGALKSELEYASDKLIRDGASQAFFPSNIHVNKTEANLKGRLITTIGNKVTSEKAVNYSIKFKYDSGKLYVDKFQLLDRIGDNVTDQAAQ